MVLVASVALTALGALITWKVYGVAGDGEVSRRKPRSDQAMIILVGRQDPGSGRRSPRKA